MTELFGEPADLEELSDRISSAIVKTVDTKIRRFLQQLRKNIREMQVSKMELINLKEDYRTGDVTTEAYYDRRKKLTRSYYQAKDEILDQIVPSVIARIEDKKETSRLKRIWKSIKSEVNLATAIINLLSAILGSF